MDEDNANRADGWVNATQEEKVTTVNTFFVSAFGVGEDGWEEN